MSSYGREYDRGGGGGSRYGDSGDRYGDGGRGGSSFGGSSSYGPSGGSSYGGGVYGGGGGGDRDRGGYSGFGGGGGGFGGDAMGGLGNNLRNISWDLSALPVFEKNFYIEHPAVTRRSDREADDWRRDRGITVIGLGVPKVCIFM